MRNLARANCRFVLSRGWLRHLKLYLRSRFPLVRACACAALAAVAADPSGRDHVQQDEELMRDLARLMR